jgi:N-acetylmuramoyl-L-alanine amidase
MKRVILIILVILFAASVRLSAEKTAEVIMRYSRHDAVVRIVIEAEEEVLRNTGVSTSLSGIAIDFPAQLPIVEPKDFPYDVVKRNRSLIINLKDVRAIKTSRLTAPSRLVFDLTTPVKQQGNILSPQQVHMPPQPKAPSVSPGPIVSPGPQTAAPPGSGQVQQPFPPSRRPSEKISLVVLDPGHGGYDYGIITGEAREKDVDLSLSRDLSTAMARNGLTVFLDRKVDQSASLGERINFSNAKKPDLLISIHAASWNGFAVYVSTSEDLNADAAVRLYSVSSRQGRYLAQSKRAARAIAESLKRDFNAEVVLRELPLPVLNSINAPAVMIDYPSLKAFSSDPKMRAKFAASVLKGISAYEE